MERLLIVITPRYLQTICIRMKFLVSYNRLQKILSNITKIHI